MKVTLNAPVFLILYVTSIGLILLGALIGCTSEVRSAGPYEMSRVNIGINLYRTENDEAVCYIYSIYGISCFPKGAPK